MKRAEPFSLKATTYQDLTILSLSVFELIFFDSICDFSAEFMVLMFPLLRPRLVRLPKREAPSVSAAQGPVPH